MVPHHGRHSHHGSSHHMTPVLILVALGALIVFIAQPGVPSMNQRDTRQLATTGGLGSSRAMVSTGNDGKLTYLSPLALPPAEQTYAVTDKLIVVPGHAVFTGLDARQWKTGDHWALEPFQRGNGDFLIQCFAAHIRRSLELLATDVDRNLVVFSGGQSRPEGGPRSEGLSYYLLAEAEKWFGLTAPRGSIPEKTMRQHVIVEEAARDSYENILFAIARFREVTGRFPAHITVVGWEYKNARFSQLHRAALRWPSKAWKYVGIDMAEVAVALKVDPPRKVYSDKMTFDRDKSDIYLCRVNAETRKKRNPQRRPVPYFVSCPDLSPLLSFCGPSLIPLSEVPWGDAVPPTDAEQDESMVASFSRLQLPEP